MILNLIKNAKQLFIDKTKTGVEADNVEDAISVLNSNLGGYKFIKYTTTMGATAGHKVINISDIIGYNTKDFWIVDFKLVNTSNGGTYGIPIGTQNAEGVGLITVDYTIRLYDNNGKQLSTPAYIFIMYK